MAFEKGHKKAGGRPKGGRNKRTVEVEAVLLKMKCDPIEIMAKVALGKISGEDAGLKFAAAKELAQYIAPKRRSIEIVNPLDDEGNRQPFLLDYGSAPGWKEYQKMMEDKK